MGGVFLRFLMFLTFFFVVYRPPCVFCEEVDAENYEMEGLSNVSGFDNLMEEISLLYNDIHIGKVGIKPAYEVKEVFDDNVFDASDERKEDFYTLHKPELELITPFSDHILAHLKYDAEIYDYEYIQERDRVNQSLKGTVEFYFANDFKLTFSDHFRKHRIPPGVQRRFFADIEDLDIPIEDQGIDVFVDRRDITTNAAAVDIDFPDFFEHLGFSLHYKNNDVSYKRDEFEGSEYNTDTINADIDYHYPSAPVTISSGFLYAIDRYDSEKNNDAINKEIPFDIVWNFTPKNKLYVNTNYKISKFRKHSTLENFEGWEVVLGNRYTINPVSSIELYGERSVKEQRLTDNNSYFDTNVGIKYMIQHARFEGYLDAQYFNMKFFESIEQIEDEEEVDGISVNLNIKYKPQEWWFAEFDYAYNRRDNNISLGDFTKNTVTLGLGINF
ncbi:MAG: outer membrane beta-barrel protein [Candidatus Kuenenia sp.]|nr:outer membrane beta-barrel protein [Candidatus Kuenenia hertensis]